MPFQLSIKAFGETILERKLTRFSSNLTQPEAALTEVGTMLREIVQQQFATEGGHASGGWPALTEERIAYKAKKGLDPHILRATDRLMNSLIDKFDQDHIERPSSDALVFGSSVPYGIYHQSSKPRSKIPFRPPVALNESDKRTMVKRVQAALLPATDKATWGA